MARDRDHGKYCPASLTKNKLLVILAILAMSPVVLCQRVRMETEVVAYSTESVDLHCQFVCRGHIQLNQVSWIWEPTAGHRVNIAVFHPVFGQNFPDSPLSGRVAFIQGTLENPAIRISQLKMADEGRYTCEYATYPSGNEQGTTSLLMLARPKTSAPVVVVQAGSQPVTVAWCQAADGKPAANIEWRTLLVGGTHATAAAETAEDGTATVRSEYRLTPTPADDGKNLICIVRQHAQDNTSQSFSMALSVEYPPMVSIEGYDSNWYIGRPDASLTCQAKANPLPTIITWRVVHRWWNELPTFPTAVRTAESLPIFRRRLKTHLFSMSGPMPAMVEVEGNRLRVRKVDQDVNTTFVCEVKNRLGSGTAQVTTLVIEGPAIKDPPADAEQNRLAIAAQGAVLARHEQQLQTMADALRRLAAAVHHLAVARETPAGPEGRIEVAD